MPISFTKYFAIVILSSLLYLLLQKQSESFSPSIGICDQLGATESRIRDNQQTIRPEAIHVSLRMIKPNFGVGEPLHILEVVSYQNAQSCYYPDHDDFSERLRDGEIHLAFDDKTIEPGSRKDPHFAFPIHDGFIVGYVTGKPNKTTYRLTNLQTWYTPIPPGQASSMGSWVLGSGAGTVGGCMGVSSSRSPDCRHRDRPIR